MKTDAWISQINEIKDNFRNTFSLLTDEQMNWKPDQKTWSIAQNIDHLIIVNESYYPIISAAQNGNYKMPFMGRFEFIVNFLGKTLLNSVQPDRRKKTKTFPIWEPSQSPVHTGILNRFDRHQEELKLQIKHSEDLLKKGTVVSSPANKNIVYKLEIAFDIIVAHERRHFEQAKEVLGRLK